MYSHDNLYFIFGELDANVYEFVWSHLFAYSICLHTILCRGDLNAYFLTKYLTFIIILLLLVVVVV